MGKYLSETHQKEYLSIGFAFSEGSYTAVGESGIKSYPAEPSYPGTYEFFFNAIKVPFFILDLRNLDGNDERQKWLMDRMGFRQIGGLKVEDEFYETSITDDFDSIIFINSSHATHLLNNKPN
jgi:erythromycin esterase